MITCTLRCSFPYVASKFHIQYQVGSHIGQQRIASNVPRNSRYDYKILSVSINQSINQASIIHDVPASSIPASSIQHQASSIQPASCTKHPASCIMHAKKGKQLKEENQNGATKLSSSSSSPRGAQVRYGTVRYGKVGPKIKNPKRVHCDRYFSACIGFVNYLQINERGSSTGISSQAL